MIDRRGRGNCAKLFTFALCGNRDLSEGPLGLGCQLGSHPTSASERPADGPRGNPQSWLEDRFDLARDVALEILLGDVNLGALLQVKMATLLWTRNLSDFEAKRSENRLFEIKTKARVNELRLVILNPLLIEIGHREVLSPTAS